MTDRLTVVIAVVSNKGGVGRTTTSVNLAAALAAPRRRVLLVDLDSQASASVWCGVQREELKPSAATCLLDNYPVLQAVRRTPTPHLDLITGSMDLANADLALCDKPAREMALKHMLQRVTARYDVIMLDCPPGMSLLTVNALVAANALIIPVMLRYLVVENLSALAASIETVRSRLGGRSRLLGLLLSMMDGRSRGETELRERLRAQFRQRIFRTEIPVSRALEAAPAAAQPVVAFAPRSTSADAFRRLAGEVLERARPLRRS